MCYCWGKQIKISECWKCVKYKISLARSLLFFSKILEKSNIYLLQKLIWLNFCVKNHIKVIKSVISRIYPSSIKISSSISALHKFNNKKICSELHFHKMLIYVYIRLTLPSISVLSLMLNFSRFLLNAKKDIIKLSS